MVENNKPPTTPTPTQPPTPQARLINAILQACASVPETTAIEAMGALAVASQRIGLHILGQSPAPEVQDGR